MVSLLKKGFTRGKLDTTLFLMFDGKDMLIVQIYVDDIIFGSINENLCKEFSKTMQDEFEMSMMGELKFFLVYCLNIRLYAQFYVYLRICSCIK